MLIPKKVRTAHQYFTKMFTFPRSVTANAECNLNSLIGIDGYYNMQMDTTHIYSDTHTCTYVCVYKEPKSGY